MFETTNQISLWVPNSRYKPLAAGQFPKALTKTSSSGDMAQPGTYGPMVDS